MNIRQKRFCEEYIVDMNGKKAAIRAGYNPKTATQQAARLLTYDNVLEKIQSLMEEQSKRTEVTADRVIKELAKVAFQNPSDVVDLNTGHILPDVSTEDLSTISGIRVKKIPMKNGEGEEIEMRFPDKVRALELLGRHLGIFSDKYKLTIDQPIVISGSDLLED